jgi:transposase
VISLSPRVSIHAAIEPVDFRKGFDGLVAIVRDAWSQDPFGGVVFCFFNRWRDRVKLLVWDSNGFWLLYKRLERGTCQKLSGRGARVELDRAQLSMLLEGLDTTRMRFRKHFSREARPHARDHDGGRARVAR